MCRRATTRPFTSPCRAEKSNSRKTLRKMRRMQPCARGQDGGNPSFSDAWPRRRHGSVFAGCMPKESAMRILLADDHVLFRDAMVQYFRHAMPDATVMGAG